MGKALHFFNGSCSSGTGAVSLNTAWFKMATPSMVKDVGSPSLQYRLHVKGPSPLALFLSSLESSVLCSFPWHMFLG